MRTRDSFSPSSITEQMDASSRELVRQKIDKEIQDTIELVRRLKTRRNTLAPISRLPTEILSKIFFTLTFSDFEQPDLSWIRAATAVCHHWRVVAIECPSLWSFISFGKPLWVEEMLRRSKTVPLIVKADGPLNFASKVLDAMRLTLQHISRIKALRLNMSQLFMGILFDGIDGRAPLLESLYLFNYGGEYTLPETLFVSGNHHLQRLELVNCNISWSSPLLNGLVHIKFHTTLYKARPTIMQVLQALEKMPLLESLDLSGSLPVVPDDSFRSPETKRIVRLSRLTNLRLDSTAIECAYFVDHISYPASTSLRLSCEIDSDISILFNTISSVCNGNDNDDLLRSLLIRNESGAVTIQGWTTTSCLMFEPAQIDLDLVYPVQDVQTSEKMIIDVCNALTLTNLHTLFVYVYGSTFPEAAWLSAVGHLASIRTVYVHGPAILGLVSALSTGLGGILAEEDPSRDCTGKLFLCNLRELYLFDLDRLLLGDTGLLENLRDCLMSRCYWNADLRKLYLECTDEHYEQIELLSEIVVDVEWEEE